MSTQRSQEVSLQALISGELDLEILTANEFGDVLRVSSSTVSVWCNNGREDAPGEARPKLSAYKMGREWRIPVTSVKAMLKEMRLIRGNWANYPIAATTAAKQIA